MLLKSDRSEVAVCNRLRPCPLLVASEARSEHWVTRDHRLHSLPELPSRYVASQSEKKALIELIVFRRIRIEKEPLNWRKRNILRLDDVVRAILLDFDRRRGFASVGNLTNCLVS